MGIDVQAKSKFLAGAIAGGRSEAQRMKKAIKELLAANDAAHRQHLNGTMATSGCHTCQKHWGYAEALSDLQTKLRKHKVKSHG